MQQTDLQLVDQPCPLCESDQTDSVCFIKDHTYGVPGQFQIVRCLRCRHLYLNPRPSDDCLMECYPAEYAPHDSQMEEPPIGAVETTSVVEPSHDTTSPDSRAAESDASAEPTSLLRRVVRAFPGLRRFLNWLGQENAVWLEDAPVAGDSRLLEIGCAHGGYLIEAQQRGWSIDGIEPSTAAAEKAQAKGLDIFRGTLTEAIEAKSVQHASRDAVVMWMVLEHVPNPKETVQDVANILKPNGTFALSIPNAATWERHLFGRYWLGYDASRHLQTFSGRTIRLLLEKHGFVNIRIIHQANTRYWWGSLACWAMERFPKSRWPHRWLQYFRTEPPKRWHWLLIVPGKLNALLRLSGRITVVAKKPAPTNSN